MISKDFLGYLLALKILCLFTENVLALPGGLCAQWWEIVEHEAAFLPSGATISKGNMKPKEESECPNCARAQGHGKSWVLGFKGRG